MWWNSQPNFEKLIEKHNTRRLMKLACNERWLHPAVSALISIQTDQSAQALGEVFEFWLNAENVKAIQSIIFSTTRTQHIAYVEHIRPHLLRSENILIKLVDLIAHTQTGHLLSCDIYDYIEDNPEILIKHTPIARHLFFHFQVLADESRVAGLISMLQRTKDYNNTITEILEKFEPQTPESRAHFKQLAQVIIDSKRNLSVDMFKRILDVCIQDADFDQAEILLTNFEALTKQKLDVSMMSHFQPNTVDQWIFFDLIAPLFINDYKGFLYFIEQCQAQSNNAELEDLREDTLVTLSEALGSNDKLFYQFLLKQVHELKINIDYSGLFYAAKPEGKGQAEPSVSYNTGLIHDPIFKARRSDPTYQRLIKLLESIPQVKQKISTIARDVHEDAIELTKLQKEHDWEVDRNIHPTMIPKPSGALIQIKEKVQPAIDKAKHEVEELYKQREQFISNLQQKINPRHGINRHLAELKQEQQKQEQALIKARQANEAIRMAKFRKRHGL